MLTLERLGRSTLNLKFDKIGAEALRSAAQEAARHGFAEVPILSEVELFGSHIDCSAVPLRLVADEGNEAFRRKSDVVELTLPRESLEFLVVRLTDVIGGRGFYPAEIADVDIPSRDVRMNLFGIEVLSGS